MGEALKYTAQFRYRIKYQFSRQLYKRHKQISISEVNAIYHDTTYRNFRNSEY